MQQPSGTVMRLSKVIDATHDYEKEEMNKTERETPNK